MRHLVLLLLVACGGPDPGPIGEPPDSAPPDPVGIVEVTFESPVPTVATIRWGSGSAHVRYGEDGALDHTSPAGDGEVQLIGLAAGATYDAELVRADGVEPFTIEVPAVPGRPGFTISDHDPVRSQVDDGYVFTAIVTANASWALAVDGRGRNSWSVEVPPEDIVIDLRIGRDAASVLYMQLERTRTEDRGFVHRVALDGAPISSTRTLWAHHMARELSDGSIGWMGHDFRDLDWEGETWSVFTDTILEAPEGSPDESTTTEVYNLFDDYVGFYVPCEHVLYAETRFDLDDLHEWTHANSLLLSEDEASWLIAPRLHDALLKVDRATGTTVWQMGGANNTFTPILADGQTEDDFWWSHAHLSEAWDGGFTMFDNASHKVPPVSAAVEYRYDEGSKTVEKVWSYEDPLGRFVPYLGDVRKLPGGNYLVSWSSLGTLTEITPDGDVVWRAQAEPGAIMGRVVWVADPYAPVEE